MINFNARGDKTNLAGKRPARGDKTNLAGERPLCSFSFPPRHCWGVCVCRVMHRRSWSSERTPPHPSLIGWGCQSTRLYSHVLSIDNNRVWCDHQVCGCTHIPESWCRRTFFPTHYFMRSNACACMRMCVCVFLVSLFFF